MITDWFFRIPPVRVAEARAASAMTSTWVYRFDHPEPQDNRGFGLLTDTISAVGDPAGDERARWEGIR